MFELALGGATIVGKRRILGPKHSCTRSKTRKLQSVGLRTRDITQRRRRASIPRDPIEALLPYKSASAFSSKTGVWNS